MSFLDLRPYKVYVPSYWDPKTEDHVCDIEMTSIPSKEDILEALFKAGQYNYPDKEYESNLKVERPSGWCYKPLLVMKTKPCLELVWKIVPKT